METKKNPAKDIHRYSKVFFLIGLIASTTLVICAFEWTSQSQRPIVRNLDSPDESIFLIEPPSTQVTPPVQPAVQTIKKIIPVIPQVLPDGPVEIEKELPSEESIPYHEIVPGPEPEDTTFIYVFAEKQPEPVGGYGKFYTEIAKEIKYPAKARNAFIQGKVFVQFVVNQKGEPGDFQVLGGIGFGCDEESIRVIANTRWIPGKQRGKPVKVRMILPVIFKLN